MVYTVAMQQDSTTSVGLHRARRALLLAAIYGLAALLSLALMRQAGGIAIVWLPNAIAIGIILRAPRATWLELFGAVAAAGLAAHWIDATAPLRLLGFTAANLVTIGFAVLGTDALLRRPASLSTVRELAVLVGTAAVAAPLLGGALGAWTLTQAFDGTFLAALLSWWAAEAISAVLIVPAILTWDAPMLRGQWSTAKLAELLAMLGGLAGVLTITHSVTGMVPLFLAIPFLLWVGLRLGRVECALAGQLFAGLAIWLASLGKLALLSTWQLDQLHVTLLQGYIACVVLSALTVAVLDHARGRDRRRLAQSQAMLSEISERMPGVVYRYRLAPDGQRGFDYISRSAQRIYGLDIATARRDLDWAVRGILAEDRERMRHSLERSAAALTPWHEEFRVRIGGGMRWIRSEAMPQRMADGATVWNGVQIDITEAKSREQELAAAERRQRLIMDAMSDGVMLVDAQGVIGSANPAAGRSFGYDENALIGRNLRLLLAEGDVLRQDGGSADARREVTGRRRDGSTFPIDLSIAAFNPADGSRGFIATVHDLTERRRTEDQLRHAQKLEAVGQLTGGVAHDFNNMLAVIQGNLELILERVRGEAELRRFGDAAMRAAVRGAELTRRLLAFSRRQSLAPQTTDVNELIDGMEDMLRSALGEAVTYRRALGQDLAPVIVDRGELENALLNLAVNARDAMPGGGTLTLATDRVRLAHTDESDAPPPGDYLRIRTSDTGHGMPAEVAARAFEPFFTTKPVGHGSGMGLSMVYGFVRQSGGQVRIDSAVGRGTTISILLPIGPGAVAAGDEPLPGQGRRVLVVDSEPDAAARAAALLTGLGYRVVTAGDGQAALASLAETAFALVLTAVSLPNGVDGRHIAEAARRRRPPIPTLYMSARLDAALDEGVALLPKPFGRDALAAAVARALAAPPPGR